RASAADARACAYRILVEPRMCLQDLLYSCAGSQFLENQLNGDASTRDYRLAHHHIWIGNNHLLVVAHARLPNPAYRFATWSVIRMAEFWCRSERICQSTALAHEG